MKVLLDPANGKETIGRRSPDSKIQEWEWSREIISLIEKRLDSFGINHERTWNLDTEPGQRNRCKLANQIAKTEDCILISIHLGLSGKENEWRNKRGWSNYISPNATGKTKTLASIISDCAKNSDIHVRRPDKSHSYWLAKYAICRSTSMPSVFIECMYMDNLDDYKILNSDEGKNKISEIIVEGICTYLGVPYYIN